MCYENIECWRIVVGISLLFCVPSVCYFWKYIIEKEKKNDK